MPRSESELAELLGRLDERTEYIQNTVEKLAHTVLDGNGSPALTVTVATTATRVAAIEEQLREAKTPRHIWVGIIFSALIAIVVLAIQIVSKI